MAENKRPVVGLTNQERFPLLADLSMLNKMRQDEFAPKFNFQSGDRLKEPQLKRVVEYAQNIRGKTNFWKKGSIPTWIQEYVSRCIKTVPFYSRRKGLFVDQPTISRSDINSEPWNFVPLDAKLDDLLVYQTSGTTGKAMDVLFDPVAQACWLPQLQSVLDQQGIFLDTGPTTVAIALICSQSSTLTYASLSTYLEGAGVLKINLHPDDWNDPSHRNLFLEKCNPQVLTGDPFAFLDLLELKPLITPKAMVSSAMKLTDGIRNKLERYFKCPVVDIYSLTECRNVAYAEKGRYRAIRPELYLEVFDKDKDILLPYGERGELVITGGNNPFLPLIRYRTGDFCQLQIEEGIPYVLDLEARKPVPFYTITNRQINNIEISRALMDLPLAGFKLHQDLNHRIIFKGWSNDDVKTQIEGALRNIFGGETTIRIEIFPLDEHSRNKTTLYSSDFEQL